ncbi:hypothetical protein DPX16_23748 [Anabarilius grahami]|uniref:Uncharacterized protein n=1 Tax=Anabarilius grahami TaxID=495550 RepID=A0A3N0YHI3_ANAGA|nr:hypothetical protein DPX16_23748 [Anabarilius grahami]
MEKAEERISMKEDTTMRHQRALKFCQESPHWASSGRYVEEFVELAYLTNWPDACLNALFLEGLDESTIRFDEPDDYFSLDDTINLILYLNGSKFVVEEVPDLACNSRSVPPETRAAWPVRHSPSSSTYPSKELFPSVLPDPHPSAGSRWPKRRRKTKPAKSPEFSASVQPKSPEFSASEQPKSPEFSASVQPKSTEFSASAQPDVPEFSASLQPKPHEFPATEPAPVPVGLLIEYEGMDWTPIPDPAPVAANESAPVAAAHKPTPAHESTPFHGLFEPSLNLPKYLYPWAGFQDRQNLPRLQTRHGRPRLQTRHGRPRPLTRHGRPRHLIRPGDLRVRPLLSPEPAKAPDPPWPPTSPDPPWPPLTRHGRPRHLIRPGDLRVRPLLSPEPAKAPDPPWPPTSPDPPWPPKAPYPPWSSTASDPPWRPPCPSAPLPAPA